MLDWIGLAQATERCRALVNAVMNLRVSKQLAILRVVLSSMDLVG
jgi:hypothetical protein